MEKRTIQLDELNLRTLVMAVLKNIWIVALVCVSALLSYNAYAKMTYQPVYTATATMMVSAKDSTSAYNSLTTTQSMATVFVNVFQSNVLREKVAQQMPEQKFTGSIGTTTIPETNLLVVTVTSPSPQMSYKGLNAVLENYESISDYLFANAQLEVIKDPQVPMLPSNPQNLSQKYPVIVVIVGFVAIAAIVALHILRNTVQTPASARRNINARVLRTIHHEQKNKTLHSKLMRKNIAPLINGSLISKAFIEDNLSLCATVEYHMRRRGQKVIMVTSVGENEGKSTIAANLALALAEKNKHVLLLDCDFRKPSQHKIFEHPVSKENAFSTFLLKETEDAESYLVNMGTGRIAMGFSRPEIKNVTELLYNGKLRKFLQQIRQEADYVIMDTPPMLAAADAEIIGRIVDTSLVVVGADFMPVSVINEWIDNLRKSTPEVCGVVLNNYHSKLL